MRQSLSNEHSWRQAFCAEAPVPKVMQMPVGPQSVEVMHAYTQYPPGKPNGEGAQNPSVPAQSLETEHGAPGSGSVAAGVWQVPPAQN